MLRIARRHPRIAVDPRVMAGKPCLSGTRVPVDLVLRYLAAGGVAEVRAAYPALTEEDVRAALDFAADVVADEAVVLAEA